jgi:hypothetical protein
LQNGNDFKLTLNSSRHQTADLVPFFLRSWWVKDYTPAPEIVWQNPEWLTLPLFSLQTDPFCDAGSIDFDLQ